MFCRASAFVALACLALTSAGCGLKGPLYSPDEKKTEVGTNPTATETSATKRRTPAVPAPQSQKVPTETPQPPPASPPDPDRPATTSPVPPPGR